MNQGVSVVPCSDYDEMTVRAALLQAINEAGGLEWVKPGMRIGIKLNLCAAMRPEAAATTHPAMARELVKLLKEQGAQVILGDSPGEPFTGLVLNRVYHMTGMESCEQIGGELNRNFSYSEVENPSAAVLRHFAYSDWLQECDAIISFSKLKAHGLMGMTAAVKNLYGVIPGTLKSEYHFRYSSPGAFADLLVDLNEYVRPQLCLCDAVEIMEGNGPTQGNARHLGLLLASQNPYLLDRTAAQILRIQETEIPYLMAARKRGLLSDAAGDLEKQVLEYRLNDFQRSGATSSWFIRDEKDRLGKRILKQALYVLMRSRPQLREGCIGCGHCEQSCPAKAIRIVKKQAVIDRKKCVRCFCCQEFCPTGAMQVQRSAVARLLGK